MMGYSGPNAVGRRRKRALQETIERLSGLRYRDLQGVEEGMDVEFFSIALGRTAASDPQVSLDVLKPYRDAGVKQVVLRLPTASPDRIEASLEDMAETLIATAQAL